MKTITPQERHRKMTKDPIPKLVTSLAVPAVASQLVNLIYNSADTYFVGKINDSASAAVGASLALITLLGAVGCGFAMGANSLISRSLGAEKNEEANFYASSAVAINTTMGIVLMVLGLLFLKPLMRLLGSTDTMMPYSCSYARYILLAAPLYCLEWALNVILRSEGSTTYAMFGLTSGGFLNIILDPIFIFTLNMGVAGAAAATAVSQVVACVVLLIPFLRGKTVLKLRLRSVSRKPKDYLLLLKIGIPTVCRQGLATLATALLTNATKAYGDAAIAGVSIAVKVYMWIRNVILGIGQGFQPVAGYNFGNRNFSRVKKSFWFACLLGTAVCLVSSAAMTVLAPQLIAIFRDSPEVITVGVRALRNLAIVLPLLAYSTYVNQMYQCLGFAGQATLLASLRQGICFVPAILLLPWMFGLSGIEMAQPASDLMTFVVSVPFQIYFFRRILKRLEALPS